MGKPTNINTVAVREGQVRSPEGEHSELLYLTSSFVFNNAAEAAARFSGAEKGNIYSRFTNPTVRNFEQRLAKMEHGEYCLGTSSGMSAILSTCLGLLQSGDHIVASHSIFGTTVNLFNVVLKKFGIHTTFVSLTDYDAWAQAITPQTKLLFMETPSNPLTEIADIQRLAEISSQHQTKLIVDNCLCTPALQQPLLLGADIVIHTATKYLDGQGRCVGGAVVGTESLLRENIFPIIRTTGPSMSPFNAWVFLKGLETLSLRMKAHCHNANIIANWLAKHPMVNKVYYPGLASHPQHQLATQQQSDYGGVVSFEVKGEQSAAWSIIDATELFSITANLGDSKSTITHPTTTTHHRLTDEQRLAAGIQPNLIRLSIGFEDQADLIADLERGLAALAN